MITTTYYGSWCNYSGFSLDVGQATYEALTDWAHEYDVDAIAREWSGHVDECTRTLRIRLCGDQFIGLHHTDPDYPPILHDPDFDLKEFVHEAIESFDFWESAERHELAGVAA